MAQKKRMDIYIPELNRAGDDKAVDSGICLLVLETDKAYRGGVEAHGRIHWKRKDGMMVTGFGGNLGDYGKTYAKVDGVATQKRIDTLHTETFTEAFIVNTIVPEVRAYYAAQAERRTR